MLNTLRISFSLKNTYRVNSILYSIRQIPLVKHLLPATIYQVKGFKIFANVLSVLWELVTIFLFKFLYFFLMVLAPGDLHPMVPARESFLHILLFLTLVGSYMHTNLFDPSRDKYYAMILLRMNALVLHPGALRLRSGEDCGGLPALYAPVGTDAGSAFVAVPADPLLRGGGQTGGIRLLAAGL